MGPSPFDIYDGFETVGNRKIWSKSKRHLWSDLHITECSDISGWGEGKAVDRVDLRLPHAVQMSRPLFAPHLQKQKKFLKR